MIYNALCVNKIKIQIPKFAVQMDSLGHIEKRAP